MVSCLLDKRNTSNGYFTLPGRGYLAELVIGWIFFFVSTIVYIIFFMYVCCDVSIFKACKHISCDCDCDCDCCDRSKPYNNNANNPIYMPSGNTNNLYSNTGGGYSSTAAYGGGGGGNASTSSRSVSRSGSRSSIEAELTPIPPITVHSPDPHHPQPEYGAAAGYDGGAGAVDYESGAGAGAGYTE